MEVGRLQIVLLILLSHFFTVFVLYMIFWLGKSSMFNLTYLWFCSRCFKMYFALEKAVWSNYRRPVDRRGVSRVIYLTALVMYSHYPWDSMGFLLSHPHFTHNYCHSLPLSFCISTRIPLPSSFPAALEIHCGIDWKTSPVSLWMLGGMYITDQRFCCLLSQMDSNTTFGPVCVHACISKSDVYEIENLPCFSSHLSFR